MNEKIIQRVNRIYAAIGATEENDLNKLKATVLKTDKVKAFFQDFRGELSDADLSNCAHTLIHNIANLRSHLKQWAKQNGYDKKEVEQVFENSLDLQIIQDLSDNDKHGYPPRNNGYSGKCPQLVNINRLMQLQTCTRNGSTIGITLDSAGVPRSFGDGTAKAIITGDVVDRDKDYIGDLQKIASDAVQAWEQVLANFCS
jgi:hypothetical protein